MMESAAHICRISAEETYPLRLKILRPGRPLVAAQFAEDECATHFGCFLNDVLVGIATIFPQALAGENKTAWQLRGMAVEENYRSQGFGEKLVQACCDFAASQNAEIIWCNARAQVVAFYQRQGFAIRGEEFLIPDVGPHYVMWRAL